MQNNIFNRFFKLMMNYSNIHLYYLKMDIEAFSNDIKNHSYININRSFILDIGSGTKPYKSFFSSFGEYISLDVNMQENGKLDLLGDISYLPIQSKTCSVAICTEVLEHVQDTKKALRELNRILKNEGYLILTIPFLIGVHDSIDYYRFTETAIKKLLDEQGFETLVLKKRGGVFSSLGSILHSIPYQIFVPNKNKNYFIYGIIFIYFFFFYPIAKFCILLDRFDKNKNFTPGYNVLARIKVFDGKNKGNLF